MTSALVVDDSPIELTAVRALLERFDLTTYTVGNGANALDIINANPIDLVICDIVMPSMSGLELLEATLSLPNPPVFIMATAMNDAQHAVAALQRGAYDYLIKPITEEPLRGAIEGALAKQRKLKEEKQQLHNLLTRDPMTGLLNREYFNRLLNSQMRLIHELELSGALLFIGVDNLRYINDTYGYYKGDIVIQNVAKTLRDSLVSGDIAARFGGDIFAINLTGVSRDNINARIQSILHQVEHTALDTAGQPRSVTVTVGAELYPPYKSLETLTANADFALHEAKKLGKNRFHVFGDSDETSKRDSRNQLETIDTIRTALVENRFVVHYQPIVDLKTGGVKHHEALIRLRGMDNKLVPPDLFIRTAENFGLIGKIDRWVTLECLKKLATIPDTSVSMAVNLSAISINDPDLLVDLSNALAESRIDPSRLIFEITETATFHNLGHVHNFIQQAKNIGCQFALDDFGVGFSSFYYIKQFDVDYLKIDGFFIKNLSSNKDDQALVKGIIEISHALDIKVIAEWVEDEKTEELLKQYGADFCQGFYYGKPAAEMSF